MKLMNGYIYKITNTVNNKIYIGLTIRTLKSRFSQHVFKKGCTYLHLAILKYGKENFKIEEIEIVPIEKLDEREIYWIDYYQSTNKNIGYNLLKGGKLGLTGLSKLSEDLIKLLIELDKNGVSHVLIGKLFNINRKTVTFILRRHTDYTKKYLSIQDLNIQEVKNFLLTNPTSKEVCEKFNISNSTLFKLTKLLGYKFLTYRERQKLYS